MGQDDCRTMASFQLRAAPAKDPASTFGGTTATTLAVMMHFGREQIRADFLIAAMEEMQVSDPKAFNELVKSLARKWYKLG